MEQEKKNVEQKKNTEPTIVGYIALIAAILIFSGIFANFEGPLKVLDFTTLIGKFGKIADEFVFRGKGGVGARDGFLFAFTLAPTVMTALGIVQVVEALGGLAAGAKLLTRVLKPIMGIPGVASLALVASFSSSDAGAAMTRELVESKLITEDERDIFVAFQYPGSATITNYFSSGSALFGIITVGIGVPLLVILILKLVGANLFRFFIVGRSKSSSKGVSTNA
jgi:nucleoside recognition membrane protein YjiH